MADKHVRAAARAIRSHTHRVGAVLDRSPRYAIVTDIDPIAAALTDSALTLDEDDLVLSQWVRKYDSDNTIDIGDTLIVIKMPDGDWLVQDVVTEADPTSSSGGGYVETFTSTGGGDHTVTHNLGTRDVIVQLHQANAPYRSDSFYGVFFRVATTDTVVIIEPPAMDWRVLVLPVVS